MTKRATNLEERVNHEDFTERDDVQWMKHVLTIGSQTRGGSTGCVGEPRGDRSTLGRSDEPCVISETCVLSVAGTLKTQRAGEVTAASAREEQTCSQSQERVQAEI